MIYFISLSIIKLRVMHQKIKRNQILIYDGMKFEFLPPFW